MSEDKERITVFRDPSPLVCVLIAMAILLVVAYLTVFYSQWLRGQACLNGRYDGDLVIFLLSLL